MKVAVRLDSLIHQRAILICQDPEFKAKTKAVKGKGVLKTSMMKLKKFKAR